MVQVSLRDQFLATTFTLHAGLSTLMLILIQVYQKATYVRTYVGASFILSYVIMDLLP